MQVHRTGNHLRDDVAPFVLLAKRNEQFGNRFEHGANVEFRIFEEAQEKFRRAVPRAAAHSGHRAIQVIHMVDDGLNRIAECELLVVVTVESELFRFHVFPVTLDALVDVLLVEVAEGIDEVKNVRLAFMFHLVERLVEFRSAIAAHRHNVQRRFETQIVERIHQIDSLVDVLHVACDADHLVRGFGSGLDGLHVHASDIRHYGELHRAVDAVADLPKQIVLAKFPRSVFLRVEKFRRILIPHFHIVDARRRQKLVKTTDKFQTEIVLVDEAAIADGAVENLDGWIIHLNSFSRKAGFQRRTQK